MEYKAGDYVRVLQSDYDRFNVGSVHQVEWVDIDRTVYLKDPENEIKGGLCFYEEEVEPVTNKEEKTMSKSWKFHTIAPDYDIDFAAVVADLSKSNPIALIHIDGESPQSYVAIHSMFLAKADLCDMPIEGYFALDDALVIDNACLYEIEQVEFKSIVEWAKQVKSANYPQAYRNKGVVTVSLPKI